MSSMGAREVLERCRVQMRAALRAHGVDRAGVFGSVARGESGPTSDPDLIVSFRPGVRRDLVATTAELEALTGLSVDVVDDYAVMERAGRFGVGTTILRDTVPL